MKITEEIAAGKEVLNRGGVLVYPTDTVWGIGCDATNEQAVGRVAKIKNREMSEGFVVLFAGIEMLSLYVDEIDNDVISFLSAAPPTTVIMQGLKGIAANAAGPDETIAVRIPKDEFCIHLINALGKPIISTSANLSGEGVPKRYADIPGSMLDEADYVINLRREDKLDAKPSRIIKLPASGGFKVIRE